MTISRPCLAYKLGSRKRPDGTRYSQAEDIQDLPYKSLWTYKYDGFRVFTADRQACTRGGNEVENRHIAEQIACNIEDDKDGEVVTYTDGVMDDFNTIQSKLTRHAGEPNFEYHIFDHVEDIRMPYNERTDILSGMQDEFPEWVKLVLPKTICNPTELEDFETEALHKGFEGICGRRFDAPYKGGRSTWNQFYLAALTRWQREEATVIGFEELESNLNEAEVGNYGQTKRSSAQDGKVLMGTLGAFIVEDIKTGTKFNVGGGVGVTTSFRQEVWNNKIQYLNKIMTYKFKPFGMSELPRHPQFVGWRSKTDMG